MKCRLRFLLAAMGLFSFCVCGLAADERNTEVLSAMRGPTPEEALARLKEGNARFVAGTLREADLGTERRIELSAGQRPIAVILTCSDSRAAPEFVFDKGLGTLFVIRVAGNVGGPAVYASMEYAIAELKAPLIVVLGHTQCGAVDAALKGESQPSESLQHLVDLVHTGNEQREHKDPALDAAIRNNIVYQTQLIPEQSAIVRQFAGRGEVKIVPALYDLESGVVKWLDTPK